MMIDAALNPAEIALLAKRDLSATTCIVFDVLRATSSIITALANGAAEIYPVSTIEEAFDLREEMPRCLLGGERNGDRIDGFDMGNSPFEYQNVPGAQIVTTTTNGTIALRACERAERIWVGAILNISELVDELRWHEPENVLLVCAGTFESFALEDAWAAGLLVTEFRDAELTDAARAALALTKLHPTALEALQVSRNGQALLAKKRGAEVEWCAQVSHYKVVGTMESAVIRPLN